MNLFPITHIYYTNQLNHLNLIEIFEALNIFDSLKLFQAFTVVDPKECKQFKAFNAYVNNSYAKWIVGNGEK